MRCVRHSQQRTWSYSATETRGAYHALVTVNEGRRVMTTFEDEDEE